MLPRFGMAAWLALAVAGSAQAQSQATANGAATETFDCGELASPQGQSTQVSPESLFERSLWASHCYDFSARAVRISFDGVRTLALRHRIDDGVETETARFLDGPPVTIEKRDGVKREASRQGASDFTEGIAPQQLIDHVTHHYRLQPMALERIAGRPAWRLDIEPQDSLRYGYRLWLDRDTGLPLKREMIGVDGQIMETLQITDLQNPSLYQGSLRLGLGETLSPSPWRAGWLPDGFVAQPVPVESPDKSARAEHRLYSDGLTSISLFVEPITSDRRPLLTGIHRLGVSFAAVRHVSQRGRPMQILVLGEAPAEVLARIAAQVTWKENVETPPTSSLGANEAEQRNDLGSGGT